MKYSRLLKALPILSASTLATFSNGIHASQERYDFGYFGTPETTFENPVGLAYCKNQMGGAFGGITTDFETDSEIRDYTVEQLGTKAALDLGACITPIDWITFGFSLNVSALTFNFETEQNSNKKLYPYFTHASPLLGLGTAIKLTDRLSWGFSLQTIAKVDLFFEENFKLESDSQFASSLDVTVRPEIFPSTGIAYNLGNHMGFEDIVVYASWRDAQESEFKLEVDVGLITELFSLDLPLELTAFQVIGKIDSVPERITVGSYSHWKDFEFDVSLTKENWTGMNDPFFRLQIPIELLDIFNAVLFPEVQNVRFQDAYSFNMLAKYRFNEKITLMAGYGFRGDAVASEAENDSILGSNMHLFKGGYTYDTKFGTMPIQLGGDAVYGRIEETDFGDNESISGDYIQVKGSAKIFF